MDIIHWKRTTIAKAPDELSKCINKFTNHNSRVLKSSNIRNHSPDIVHYHNKESSCPGASKSFIQYHSEPHRVDRDCDQFINEKFVIAQYHATLPEYSDCKPVRNIIDFRKDIYDPKSITDKIRVGFSPSALTNNGYWYDKGYIQTKRVLQRLKKSFPTEFDFDIISDAPLSECIKRKGRCNVIIDECATSSYHRSGLEGLALGKLTLCSFSDEVETVFLNASGSSKNPFLDIQLKKLYFTLKKIIERGIDYVLEEGKKNRRWMENHWSPEDVVNDFIESYER